VIRTVWLALGCLAGIGTLAVTKASISQTPERQTPRLSTIARAFPQTVPSMDTNAQPLVKGDRLIAATVSESVPDHPPSREEPVEATADIVSVSVPSSAKAITRQTVNAKSPKRSVSPLRSETKKLARVVKPKAARVRPVSDAHACIQPAGFDGFLAALNLKPRCST
jgi:hypothetical protein